MAEQDIQMIEQLLTTAGVLEVAAGVYGADGRVIKVKRGTRHVRALDDYQRCRRWLRYENANGANIWIRPAAPSHPVVMLDDLPSARAAAIARKYRGCAIETSAGNAQALVVCSRALTREERQDMARSLGRLVGADPGAVSEPRWYRLPCYRNRKPGKPFATRLVHLSYDAPALDPAPHLDASAPLRGAAVFAPCRRVPESGGRGVALPTVGGDMSRREFAFACHSLRAGVSPSVVEQRIAAHVASTGRRKAPGYSRSVVAAAAAASAN